MLWHVHAAHAVGAIGAVPPLRWAMLQITKPTRITQRIEQEETGSRPVTQNWLRGEESEAAQGEGTDACLQFGLCLIAKTGGCLRYRL